MSAALATTPGLPGRLREDGYDLPANLPLERWLEVGETLQQMERSIQWWLGDWWNYGVRQYGEMAAQASKDHVKDITGYAYHTVLNAATVAKAFDPSRRRENLSWSHHEAVKALPSHEAESLLDRAEADGLNVFAVRDRARTRRKALSGRAIDATGTPIGDDLRIWAPAEDDLTDEARAAMEQHAPQGRLRVAYVTGWLRCLVFTEQRDCFREGRWMP